MVTSEISKQCRAAKYFSVSVDSTPDVSHCDQLTVTIRYVNDNCQAVERFLTFVPLLGHTSSQIFDELMSVLIRFNLELSNCRGQTYDNANNMAGRYNGVQAKVKELNPSALFVPCSAHSLNLVGACAADCCDEAVDFFALMQDIYTFFSKSTNRWAMLRSNLPSDALTLKSLSATRWSARADATTAIFSNYDTIVKTLLDISLDMNEVFWITRLADFDLLHGWGITRFLKLRK